METITLAYQLWRLAKYLAKNREEGASASINLVVERVGSASYRELLEQARSLGLPAPPQREGVEVAVWLNNDCEPHKVRRGHTLAAAIAAALAEA